MQLVDPTKHTDWLPPHSMEWYAQLGSMKGKYTYTWDSFITEPNGELLFWEEVSLKAQNKRVLDVGCGHGDFTVRLSPIVKEIVGFDVTKEFLETAKSLASRNVSFVWGNSKFGLPFEIEKFDFAYNRKGPVSAYRDLKRVIRKGGEILGLHPGDGLSAELAELFPNLFEPTPKGTPILDRLKESLKKGMLYNADIETVVATEYLLSPKDVLRMRCFGQKPSVYEMLEQQNLKAVTKIFEKNSTAEGLPTSNIYYIVRASV